MLSLKRILSESKRLYPLKLIRSVFNNTYDLNVLHCTTHTCCTLSDQFTLTRIADHEYLYSVVQCKNNSSQLILYITTSPAPGPPGSFPVFLRVDVYLSKATYLKISIIPLNEFFLKVSDFPRNVVCLKL